MKKYIVPIVRVSYGFRDIEVEATSEYEAGQKALEIAGGFEFSEKTAEYDLADDYIVEVANFEWNHFNADLDKMFNHASFDYLVKMGYPIWDDVDYEDENVDNQYTTLLSLYFQEWKSLTPEVKAERLMRTDGLTESELMELCIKKEYEHFQ